MLVSQIRDTLLFTGVKLGRWYGSLLSGWHDLREGKCDCRQEQVFTGNTLCGLCFLRTKMRSAKVKGTVKRVRQIPRAEWKAGFYFPFYFFSPDINTFIVEELEGNAQMFESSLAIAMLNITSRFYVYPLKKEGKYVLEFHILLCWSSYFMLWCLCYPTVYYNLFYYSVAFVV